MPKTYIRQMLHQAIRQVRYSRDISDYRGIRVACKFIHENWNKRNNKIAGV